MDGPKDYSDTECQHASMVMLVFTRRVAERLAALPATVEAASDVAARLVHDVYRNEAADMAAGLTATWTGRENYWKGKAREHEQANEVLRAQLRAMTNEIDHLRELLGEAIAER